MRLLVHHFIVLNTKATITKIMNFIILLIGEKDIAENISELGLQ